MYLKKCTLAMANMQNSRWVKFGMDDIKCCLNSGYSQYLQLNDSEFSGKPMPGNTAYCMLTIRLSKLVTKKNICYQFKAKIRILHHSILYPGSSNH